MNKIQHVERSMPSNELATMVGQKPARVFSVVDPEDGLEYQVQIFPMQTGTYTAVTHGKYHNYYHTYPVTDDYVFLYYKDSLLYWGFPHEYARSDEQYLRRLAPLIMEALKKGK